MKETCRIGWIDDVGVASWDTKEAIALAICYDPVSFGEKGSEPFPICLHHAQSKGKWWKLLPLPGQSLEDSNPLVQEDARYFNIISDVVSSSIRKRSFAHDVRDAVECFNKLERYSNYWGFEHNGIFYGVEDDGHIHT